MEPADTLTEEFTSQSLKDLSPFEKLPEELQWNIFKYCPESVLELGLASTTLHSRVGRFATRATAVCVVHTLRIGQGKTDDHIAVTIQVHYLKKRLFELRLRHLLIERGFARDRIKDASFQLLFSNPQDNLSKCYIFDISSEDAGMLPHIRSCLKGSLEHVFMATQLGDVQLQFAAEVLEGVNINIFLYRSSLVTNDEAHFILRFIRDHNVKELTLGVGENVTADPVSFLYEISTLVRSITLYQEYVHGIESVAHYFFGLRDRDWVPVIVNMFARKVDTIMFESQHYKGFLPISSEGALEQLLVQLEKKISFQTDRAAGTQPEFIRENNRFTVKRTSYGLAVIHTSRVSEL